MGIFDNLYQDNPAAMGLDQSVLDYAKKMSMLKLAASFLQPGIGRRRTFGESLGQGMDAYTGTQNEIINEALARKRQAEQDKYLNMEREARSEELKAQKDARIEALTEKKQKAENERKILEFALGKNYGGVGQAADAAGQGYIPDTTQIGSMGAGLTPEYAKQYEQGKINAMNQAASVAMDQAPMNFQTPQGQKELLLRSVLASGGGKGLTDLLEKTYTVKPGEEIRNAFTNEPVATGPEKKGKIIDKTIDLGDKVQVQYADGSTEVLKKGVSPNTTFKIYNGNAGQSPDSIDTIARGIMDGTIDPNGISKRAKLQEQVYARIKQIDPSFNIVKAGANAKFAQGTMPMNSKALLNTIDPLLTKLEQAGAVLGNSSVPGYNRAMNFVKEQTGQADIVGFNNLRDDVVAEVERGLLGTGVLSDSKYLRAVKNINSAQSMEQLKAAVANTRTVIKARLEALEAGPFPGSAGGGASSSLPGTGADPLGLR